jgi:hypothetical protein
LLLKSDDVFFQKVTNAVTEALRQATKDKKGSELTETDLIGFRCLEGVPIPLFNSPPMPSDDLYSFIHEAMILYTNTTWDNLNKGKIDETKFVQPVSFSLLINIVSFINKMRNDNNGTQLRVVNKTTNHNMVKYSTEIINAFGTLIHISGDTDATIYYANVPVFVWEDKNLNKDCEACDDRAQILSEIKGNVEAFQLIMDFLPEKYCGILTSGRVWKIAASARATGRRTLHMSKSIETIVSSPSANNMKAAEAGKSKRKNKSNGENQLPQFVIDGDRVTEASILLWNAFKIVINICDEIDAYSNTIKLHSIHEEDDKKDGDHNDDEDEDDDKNDKNDDEGVDLVDKDINITLSNMTLSNNQENIPSSSKENPGRKKSVACNLNTKTLKEISLNSLTFENLYRHEMNSLFSKSRIFR